MSDDKEDYGSDHGRASLANLLEQGGRDDESTEDEDRGRTSPSSPTIDNDNDDNDNEEDTEEKEDEYDFAAPDFSIENLQGHLEVSSETQDDRFALFFQKVPVERYLKQPPQKLKIEYRKFVSALTRLHKRTADPRVLSTQNLLEEIYNQANEDLQRAQRKTNTEPKQQQQAPEAETLEVKETANRTSRRKKVLTEKAQAHAEAKAEKQTNRRRQSLPTRAAREEIKRKKTRNRVEMYDAKGNAITGAELEEKIKKKSKTASFDAEGNKIDKTPPPEDQKLPGVEKKEKSIVTKNGKLKRSVFSRPTSIGCVKDRTSRDKIKCCAKNIKQLQHCTTFDDAELRRYYPKCQHGMFTYDELKQKPHYEAIHKRPEPVFVFLPPKEDFDIKIFGKRLQKVGKEMTKESGKGYFIADDEEEYTKLLCGGKMQAKKQAKKP